MLIKIAYFDDEEQLRYRFDRATDRRTLTSELEGMLPAGSRVVAVVIDNDSDSDFHVDAAGLGTA